MRKNKGKLWQIKGQNLGFIKITGNTETKAVFPAFMYLAVTCQEKKGQSLPQKQ